MSQNFKVTVNDASKTIFLDEAGQPLPDPATEENSKPLKEVKANANKA